MSISKEVLTVLGAIGGARLVLVREVWSCSSPDVRSRSRPAAIATQGLADGPVHFEPKPTPNSNFTRCAPPDNCHTLYRRASPSRPSPSEHARPSLRNQRTPPLKLHPLHATPPTRRSHFTRSLSSHLSSSIQRELFHHGQYTAPCTAYAAAAHFSWLDFDIKL
jgi:hypothetical protein